MSSGFWTATFLVPDAAAGRFQQTTRATNGWTEVTQDIYLPRAADVRAEIARQGYIPIRIRPRVVPWHKQELVSREYKVRFIRAIGFHTAAGMSAGRAIETVINGEENPSLRLRLEPALEILKRGGAVSEAFASLNLFDRITIAILQAGESMGDIKNAVNSAVAHLESQASRWKMALAAFSWIVIDVLMSLATVIGIQYKFLPYLEEQGISSDDPDRIASFEQALGVAYQANGLLLLIAVVVSVAIVAVIMGYLVGGQGREITEKVINRTPLVRSVIEHTALAETIGIVSRMLKARVRLTDACQIALTAANTATLKNYWSRSIEKLMAGAEAGLALAHDPISRAERVELTAHQDSEQLGHILLTISESRHERSLAANRRLIMVAFYLTLAYGVASAGSAVYVLQVQNAGLQAMMGSLGGM